MVAVGRTRTNSVRLKRPVPIPLGVDGMDVPPIRFLSRNTRSPLGELKLLPGSMIGLQNAKKAAEVSLGGLASNQ
jgi:hypothetical protein